MAFSFNLLSAVVFYAVVALFLFLNRDKLEIESKVLFLFRSKKGVNLIKKIGKKLKIFWRAFGTVAVFASFYFMIVIVYSLFKGLFDIVEKQQVAPKVVPIIPGVHVPGAPFFLPFWYGIIALGVCIIIHEFSHGIMMEVEDITLKNSGFGFLLALPVAFVEPIKEQMENADPLKRMSIASSGPFANIVFAFLLSIILSFSFYPFLANQISYNGVRITKVQESLPAEKAGLKKGSRIVRADNKTINTTVDLLNFLKTKDPNSTVNIKTAGGGNYNVGLVKEKNRTKMGILVESSYEYKKEAVNRFSKTGLDILFWFKGLFSWIQRLNFLIGVVNFLPIWAIDGEKVLSGLFDYILPNEKIKIHILNIILYLVLSLFLINFIVPYIK